MVCFDWLAAGSPESPTPTTGHKRKMGLTPEQQKARGNVKFKEKDFEGAIACYSAGILSLSTREAPLRVILLSNRATCHEALGHNEASLEDTIAALEIDPTHTKSYFRLAKAKLRVGFSAEAGRAVCAAVALSRGRIDPALEKLYQSTRDALTNSANTLRLPPSSTSVSLVAPGTCSISNSFTYSLSGRVVCALPGEYSESIQIIGGKDNIIIGLGQCVVDQIPGRTHSLFVHGDAEVDICLLYTSPSPRDLSTSRMPSSA